MNVPMIPSLTLTVTCADCGWKAQLTGDDPIDVVASLRKILIEHHDARHGTTPVPSSSEES
jgi:hypothetical protein